ncbi:MAG: tetratricopeptide repeat protein [Calditrichaeota bacterium]|nr:MAG: tetratricopeptide repeat protein [Calditrichota bacterium]
MFDELDDLLQDFTLEETEKVQTVKLQEGERRIVSILFADIKGFTSLSEKLDPEQVRNILDKLLKLFSNCIEKHGGYIDKYEGDLVMALFGAKSANENDTERAIHTGLEMLESLDRFNSVLKKIPITKELNIELDLRIGINTGLVTTGKIGLEREGDFTVYGDAVNLASRMESNAPTNRIMISEGSKKLVEDWFDFEGENEIEVKGKAEKIKVFLVQSTKGKKLPKWLQHKRSVFVGRDKELEFLENSYQRVLKNLELKQTGEESKPIVVGLKGVAGLGKSRLAYEFLKSKLQSQPHRNLSAKGFCSNVSTSPYSMFTTLIKNYLGITLLDPKELIREKLESGFKTLESFLETESEKENLRETLPIIGFLFGLKYDDVRLEQKGQGLQINIQIALRYFLETASFRANKLGFPFLVVFEDLHWMEESSTSALKFLLRTLNLEEKRENKPLNQILFILLYRPDYEVQKEIKIESDFSETELSTFDKKTSMKLIKTVLGEIEIPEKTKTLLLEKSSGNPFYVEEWIEFIKSKDLIVLEEGNLTLKETEIPVPQSLSALILSRLDSLETEQKVLLQKASVIGREFSVQVLTEVEKKFGETEGLPTKLFELENRDFIQILINLSEYYIFNHVITQEVAYNSLLISNRRILHKIIAETIEEKFQGILESFYVELANHYEKAEETEKAIEFLKKAGDQAQENFENQKAIQFYDRFLEKLKGFKNLSGLEIDTLIQKGETLKLIGEWKEPENLFKRALELSQKIEDKRRIAKSNHSLGWLFDLQGDSNKAVEFYEKSLKISEELGNKRQISKTVRNMGIVYEVKGDYVKAMEFYEKDIKFCEKNGDKRGVSKTVGNMGNVYLHKGDYDKAMECYEKLLRFSEGVGDKSEISRAVGNMGNVYLHKGDYDKAMECFEKLLNICEEIGDKRRISIAVGNMGLVYRLKDDYDKAMECYEEQLKICGEVGDKMGISSAIGNMGNVYWIKGDYDKAMECYEKKLKISKEIGEKRGISIAVESMGNVYKGKGGYDKAMECYEKAIKISEKLGIKYYLCGQLNNKAKLLFLLKRNKEAQNINFEVLRIAKEIGRKDVTFEGKVLTEKINFALGDKENPPKQLQKMLIETEEIEEIVELNYELWKINSEEKYKIEALKLYQKLYSKTPKFDYKKKIEELEK